MKQSLVCMSCGDRYSKLGYIVNWLYYWEGCVGDCSICHSLARLYVMVKKVVKTEVINEP
jgi:hypothetical protein